MWCETENRLSFSLGVYVTVFQIEIFVILASARNCMKRKYTKQQIYICSDSQAVSRALEASSTMSKLVLECGQAICANKEMLLWVPGQNKFRATTMQPPWLERSQTICLLVLNM
jgi:hypothetical protein